MKEGRISLKNDAQNLADGSLWSWTVLCVAVADGLVSWLRRAFKCLWFGHTPMEDRVWKFYGTLEVSLICSVQTNFLQTERFTSISMGCSIDSCSSEVSFCSGRSGASWRLRTVIGSPPQRCSGIMANPNRPTRPLQTGACPSARTGLHMITLNYVMLFLFCCC